MSNPAAREDALTACLEYDRWASEVARLTEEIREATCPKGTGGYSCFQVARTDPANPVGPSLATLAMLVADCPSCSRLCELIAARKHARQRFGVAKRRIRSVARVAR